MPWAIAVLTAACAAHPTLVDAEGSGFALYRSGRLGRDELAALCALGVEEIVVLSGDASRRECAWRAHVCPGLKVRYDRRQDAAVPLSKPFLDAFDRWIAEARGQGRKVAVRCRQGWHRTGRLIAYYRLRHDSLSPADAVEEMGAEGRFLWRFPGLDDQVHALAEWTAGRPCTGAPDSCVRLAGHDAPAGAIFPLDACP